MRSPALSPRASVAAFVAALAVIAAAPSVSASSVDYAPPVDAVVSDEFRPPTDRFGAGNRGVDYAAAAGQSVRASADGVVTFAGPVGGALHVVVLHADGVRTSYSFLGSTAVRRAARIAQGDVVGTTGSSPLHFGARVAEEYVDPLALLGSGSGRRPHARLLPDNGKGLPAEAAERSALERLVRAVGRFGRTSAAFVDWAGRRALPLLLHTPPGDVVQLAQALAHVLPDPDLAHLVATLLTTAAATNPPLVLAAAVAGKLLRRPCTPASTPTPRPSAHPARPRRIAVLVAGLGSSSAGKPSITDLDTTALGYAPADVVQFSYRGGRTDEVGYTASDTQNHPAESGRRLRALLERLAREQPGVPIDVFAHSLGGLVARSALVQPSSPSSAAPPVGHLVTFGTPHDGADLASAAQAVRGTPLGQAAALIGSRVKPFGLDPTRPTVAALAPGSPFVRDLSRHALPPTVKATSIATRRDLVVPAPRSWLKGATNVVVPGHGGNAHARLPGSSEAHRETALALAGLPPTCEPLLDAALDAASASAVQLTEASLALGARVAAGPANRATWSPPVG